MSSLIRDMRVAYRDQEDAFTESDLVSKEPIAQFQDWFQTACQNKDVLEANAMCLATATKGGRPSARMVLLRGYGKEGFSFYTNYNSRKGRELTENPFAALTFFWGPLQRSVRIEGTVEKVSEEDSVAYFSSRPLGSRIAATVSQQSEPVSGREALTERVTKLMREHEKSGSDVAKPLEWGGFRVVPDTIEFWQGQTTRLHDRIRFRRSDETNEFAHAGEDGWIYERLQP